MPSKVDLCNKALRRLGEDPIIALDNNTLWGRRCNAALPDVTRTVLAMDIWRSCTKRAELAASSETPISYNSAFPLPADFLRLGAIRLSPNETWSLESNQILTNKQKTDTLEILYVAEVVDTNKYSAPLYEAISLGLAHELSGYSSATNVAKDDIYQLYKEALSMAMNVNAKETPVNSLASSSWIDARFTSIDRVVSDFYEGY